MLPPNTHALLVELLAGSSLCQWAATSADEHSVVLHVLRRECPSRIELTLADYSGIYQKCVTCRHSDQRNEDFGMAVATLEQSMDEFMFCWSALRRLQALCVAFHNDGTPILPAEDAPPDEFDEAPSDFDLRMKKNFKELRAQQLEYINSLTLDSLQAKVEDFFALAATLGSSSSDSHEYYYYSSDSHVGHSDVSPNLYTVPSSSYQRQIDLANAMRDVRGFCYKFARLDFPDAVMLEHARRRAAEADILWNEWNPSPSEVSYAAVVLDKPFGGPNLRLLKSNSTKREYQAHCLGPAGDLMTVSFSIGTDGFGLWKTHDSDWAQLKMASMGMDPWHVRFHERLCGESQAQHVIALHDSQISPIMGEWAPVPLAGAAPVLSTTPGFKVLAATASEVMKSLRSAGGFYLAGGAS